MAEKNWDKWLHMKTRIKSREERLTCNNYPKTKLDTSKRLERIGIQRKSIRDKQVEKAMKWTNCIG